MRMIALVFTLFLSTPSARRATWTTQQCLKQTAKFLSTPSARRATDSLFWSFVRLRYFYPRPPRGGRRLALPYFFLFVGISIHALREEGDRPVLPSAGRSRYFYPRPPRGGRPSLGRVDTRGTRISIHALREEGDRLSAEWIQEGQEFLSTPSARRATKSGKRQKIQQCNFYPRPPRGGRRRSSGRTSISKRFLSTPSARRATLSGLVTPHVPDNFYPRPPRGGRPPPTFLLCFTVLFLSTPSARRATAKTERKHPAFVSLYTSLHKLQRDVCKTNRKITPLLAQTAGIPVRSVPENHVCCRFALAGHQKISTLSWANSGCSPTCSTLVW